MTRCEPSGTIRFRKTRGREHGEVNLFARSVSDLSSRCDYDDGRAQVRERSMRKRFAGAIDRHTKKRETLGSHRKRERFWQSFSNGQAARTALRDDGISRFGSHVEESRRRIKSSRVDPAVDFREKSVTQRRIRIVDFLVSNKAKE